MNHNKLPTIAILSRLSDSALMDTWQDNHLTYIRISVYVYIYVLHCKVCVTEFELR